jgi:putative endonuclease
MAVARSDARRSLGAFGEAAVARWYEGKGARVVDRNWRVREGELDLVIADRRSLRFVEVKTRRSTRFGSPIEAITPAKAARLRRLVGLWLRAHSDVRPPSLVLEVACVTLDAAGRPSIEIVPLDV